MPSIRSRLPVEIRAEAAHKKGVELERDRQMPNGVDAHDNLGLALNSLGRHAKADAFEQAQALRPTSFESRPRHGDAFKVSRGDGSPSRSAKEHSSER